MRVSKLVLSAFLTPCALYATFFLVEIQIPAARVSRLQHLVRGGRMTIEIGFFGFGRVVCDDPCGIGCLARSTMHWGEKRIERKAIEEDGWHFDSARYEWFCPECFVKIRTGTKAEAKRPREQETRDSGRKLLEESIDALALAIIDALGLAMAAATDKGGGDMGLIRGALWTCYVQCDYCLNKTESCFDPKGHGARVYAIGLGYSEGMDGDWTCPDCKKAKNNVAQAAASLQFKPSPAEEEMIKS